MCIDILTKEEIITYRADEHDLLMSIRNGEFQKPEGGYRPEFFELVDDLEKENERCSRKHKSAGLPRYRSSL